MNIKLLSVVLLRMGALVFAVRSAIALLTFFTITQDFDYSANTSNIQLIAYGVVLLLCILTWMFPQNIVRLLTPKNLRTQNTAASTSLSATHSITETQYLTIGILLIGVWMLAQAIPDLLYWINRYFLFTQHNSAWAIAGTEGKSMFVATIIEFVVGGLLLRGAGRIASMLAKIQD